MKIIETRVMRGPNYWSVYRKKLIILKLDIEELENFPTNSIKGFSTRLEKLIPSLYNHRCSEKDPGGFFLRIKEGTWMGHVVEHIALEIQTLAGMDCGFGRTRSQTGKGIYTILFSYEIEEAGKYAAEAALRIADALVMGEDYDIEKDIAELCNIKKKYSLGPSTNAIIKAAELRGIPFTRLDDESLITLGYGQRQKKIRATITDTTSNIGVELACDKEFTKRILSKAHIPVPRGELIYSEEELKDALSSIPFPLVIKPVDGNHGRGITTNITTAEEATKAFLLANKVSDAVIVEEFIEGFDYRFLIINYKMEAAAKRLPAMITGNGDSTIEQLIESVNKNPERGDGHEKTLTKIKIDDNTLNILAKKRFELTSVLPAGEQLFLKDTANISTGGTAIDVTDKVHPYNKFMLERAARLLNLNICGIDVMTKNIEIPITSEIGRILEINASPGLRMHLNPSNGKAHNVGEPIIKMLFPEINTTARIPIIAITGTNGKTTTTRLVAHLAKQTGLKVGYTTTDGIYIGDHLIHEGDCTGPVSAKTILFDPTVDFAVLECARGGILRSGLGFDNCDISIITNITEDHIGLKDIHSLEEMANVKAVVAQTTFKEGYAILNADDDLVYKMKGDLDCRIALFSIDSNSKRIKEHYENNGLAAIVEDEYIVVFNGKVKTQIVRVDTIPLSFDGKADCMIKNILPAILVGFIQNFPLDNIRKSLKTFIPSPEQTPGRMNLFHFKNFDLMIDYAHNIDGFEHLKKFMDKTPASVKIGIIGVPGDRKKEDILQIGQISATIFDEIIIRHDKDLRGRTKQELSDWFIEGIKNSKRNIPVKIISDGHMAAKNAMDNAKPAAFIFMSIDTVFDTIHYIKKIKEEESVKTSLSPSTCDQGLVEAKLSVN